MHTERFVTWWKVFASLPTKPTRKEEFLNEHLFLLIVRNITPKLLNILFTLLASNVSTTKKKLFFYILLKALISYFLKNKSRINFFSAKGSFRITVHC